MGKFARIIWIIIFLFIGVNLFAQDFEPIVKLKIAKGKDRAECSGVVIGEDTKNYYILSCEHLFFKIKNPQYTITSIYTDNGEIISVDMRCKLIKSDEGYDLSYFSVNKVDSVKIKPLQLATSNLLKNSKASAFGFVQDELGLVKTDLIIESYDETRSQTGVWLLKCNGPVITGMSGGPLIANNEVHGILSTGTNTYGTFVPAFECHNFLKK